MLVLYLVLIGKLQNSFLTGDNMTEILWHGRGGQGAFTAAKLLGASYIGDNKYSLAFPSFGPERRGAPILAFTKLDNKAIGDRSQIKKADYVVFLDDTLFSASALKEIKAGGKIIVNTKKTEKELKEIAGTSEDSFVAFDGDSIAKEFLGIPVSNTALLAVLAKISGLISKEEIIKAIGLYMNPKLAAKNTPLVEAIFVSTGSTTGGEK